MVRETGDPALRKICMGDCAINIGYEATQDADGIVTVSAAQKLTEVAVESAKTARAFDIDPKVALLSFSTRGSGKGATVSLSAAAARLAGELDPALAVDGEMQFDAAVSPAVGQLKFPASRVAVLPTPSSSPTWRAATSAKRSRSGWAAMTPTAHFAGVERAHQRFEPWLHRRGGLWHGHHHRWLELTSLKQQKLQKVQYS
jgi:hypothetical protein